MDTRIGVYRLIRELGQGGMGTVYLAERADDAFRKIVALKVMRADKVNEEFTMRFRQERQILAALDHPNIARIIDGGATPDNLPYCVMDYVDGVPIERFCDSAQLNMLDRLSLFLQVLSAVQYLHENHVIHRDLKTNNILVSANGTAKLLDFGIAKVQTPGEPGQTIALTGGPMMLMTPAYASPEQISGEPATEASDIYSLGVILYELLTGRLPFSSHESAQAQIAALLAGVEPPKPSTNVAENIKRTPETTSELRKRLTGDVDSIVLKALRAEPAQRYQSVREFKSDIQNYLAGRAVSSKNATPVYRTGKFVKRNRIGVAVATIVVLVAAFGGWQALDARIQRERAETKEADMQRLVNSLALRLPDWPAEVASTGRTPLTEEEKVTDLNQLEKAFREDFPLLLAVNPAVTPARKEIVSRTLTYLNQAERLAGSNPQLQQSVASVYQQVATGLTALAKSGSSDEGIRQSLALASARRAVLVRPPAPIVEHNAAVQQTPIVQTRGAQTPTQATAHPQAAQPRESTERAPQQQIQQAPQPPQPVEPAIPADMDEVREKYARVAAKVQSAAETAAPVQQNLQQRGLSLNNDTAASLTRMRAFLEQAKGEIARHDTAAARENLERAEYEAARVFKYFGR